MTQDEWLHSLNEWEGEGGSYSHADEFIEVVQDGKGDWVVKNPDNCSRA
ncbi:hypothetical protein OGV43_13345 [Citrobacter sp. Cb003]|nr:hypothetical protein [Citrobacter sp. Cb003]MDM3380774.1 hypothetical protein [Citrobacter sp. Cb003]